MSSLIGEMKVIPSLEGDINMDYLFIDNANEVIVDGLKGSGLGETYVSGATVTAILFDVAGVTVANSPISLVFESGSAGIYEGTLPSTVVLAQGAEYDLVVTALSGVDIAEWRRRYVANYRRD